MKNQKNSEIQKTLEQIRDLLIMQLSKSGSKSDDIGKTIGFDGSTIRHILAGTKSKRAKRNEK